MENGAGGRRWGFAAGDDLPALANLVSVRGMLKTISSYVREDGPRPVVPLCHADPSVFPCFRTAPAAEDAVIDALRSGKFNGYPQSFGIPAARRAVAEYLSRDLPYKLLEDDIFLTEGCSQAIQIVVSALRRPGANILVPRPGYPAYDSIAAAFAGLEVRHYHLLPERNWEVDLEAVEALADDNTVAIIIINPGNPCGNVFTREHLAQVAETASKLGALVIADEVYGHITFGENPFVPMGTFGNIVPVVTLGSISKRWVVPGWRLGWIAITDPDGVLRETKIVDYIRRMMNITTDPVTFIQGAVPHIIENTKDDFFNKLVDTVKQGADLCYYKIKEIDCLTCPHKPEGAMSVLVKMDPQQLKDVKDDFDFCSKLAREESVMIMPGQALGMKNWLRVTFGLDPSALEEALLRLKSFCERHAKHI